MKGLHCSVKPYSCLRNSSNLNGDVGTCPPLPYGSAVGRRAFPCFQIIIFQFFIRMSFRNMSKTGSEGARIKPSRHCELKVKPVCRQAGNLQGNRLDCFVSLRLAMTFLKVQHLKKMFLLQFFYFLKKIFNCFQIHIIWETKIIMHGSVSIFQKIEPNFYIINSSQFSG